MWANLYVFSCLPVSPNVCVGARARVHPSARRAHLSSSQYSSDGSDQRLEYGAAEEQQGLSAVLQWLQHADQHPVVL